MKKSKIFINSILRIDSFTIFSVFLFLILLMSVNYALGQYKFNIQKMPFGLSEKAVMMKNEAKDDIAYSKIIKFEEGVRIIASTQDNQIIGLYDPTMYYYQQASKDVLPERLRYFSDDDYKQESNVGVAVAQCQIFDLNKLESLSLKYHTEVIDCFENSPLAYGETVIVKNIFALSGQSNDLVYIDGINYKGINNTKQIFKQNGFVEVENTSTNYNLIEVLQLTMQMKYPKFLLIITLTFLLLYICVCYCVFSKNKNKIYLSKVNGGSFIHIFAQCHGRYLVMNGLLCSISYLLLNYLQFINNRFMSTIYFVLILWLYLCFTALVSVVIYTLMVKKINYEGKKTQ